MKVPVSGKVIDQADIDAVIESARDAWFTAGRFAERFERGLQDVIGVRYAHLCNSGSSANLLAVSALTSPLLKERRLKPGDRVITTAAGFPTTIAPILQNGLVPVFVDVDDSGNVDLDGLHQAVKKWGVKAIILAHTLGNPFNIETVYTLAKKYGLWLIEDNCDALASIHQFKVTGGFGDISTLSFYPAHHITAGEGGAVLTSDPLLSKIICSFRDWGRDCWCDTGRDNTCGKRFDWQLGDLPYGYDHKYIYSHIGYNLKITDMQAALGASQLTKLPQFVAARRKNWKALHAGLRDLQEFFILPEASFASQPSWFGFLLTLQPKTPFSRADLVRYLDEHEIGTRMLFAGDMTKQPCMRGRKFEVVGKLTNTAQLMQNAFWLGVYPGITEEMTQYVIDVIHSFIKERSKQ